MRDQALDGCAWINEGLCNYHCQRDIDFNLESNSVRW